MTPGKGGQDVEGVPVFNTFHDAVAETGANTAMIFVPPRFAADSILEAEDAGDRARDRDHRGHPRPRRAARLQPPAEQPELPSRRPELPGILSPGKANVGIIPASFFKEGNVGVVSRSGTLTYQIGNELAQERASATPASSASAATRSRARASSTSSSCSRPTTRPS